jgi:hypothetical protein
MDKKRLEYYKKKLQTRKDELLRIIARTEQEGREADDDPTVDLADKAANSYTKEFLFGQTHFVPRRVAAEAPGSGALDSLLLELPGKAGARLAVVARRFR